GAVVLDIRRRAPLAGDEPRRLPGRRLREVVRLEGRLRIARWHRGQERRRRRGGALPAPGRYVALARRERGTRPAPGPPVRRALAGSPLSFRGPVRRKRRPRPRALRARVVRARALLVGSGRRPGRVRRLLSGRREAGWRRRRLIPLRKRPGRWPLR